MPPPPIKSGKQSYGSMDGDDFETPSNNLWVGNLAADVTDSELMALFEKHGALDSITTYSSRSYAFVYFKRIDDAKAAKDALQGAVLRGNSLKIEFAKPAKPCKSLWVGGIGPSVSKEELEKEFLKFGKIEDFKFISDRNTAFVDFLRLEDASQALKNLNGKQIGGDQIRVDYLRSQPSRREQWTDGRDAREGQFPSRGMRPAELPWMPQDFMRNYSEPTHLGSKRPHPSQTIGGRKADGPPSNVLWIGYPPSVHIDEQMLHNAMILFGEIERMKSFPDRHYSFVEFRSVEEAQRAKEGLQGKLFNDPRITIAFSSSELAPGKEYIGVLPGVKGPRPDMFHNEVAFRPAQMDMVSHSRSTLPNNFPGSLPPRATRPDLLGSFEALHPGIDLSDLAALHKFQDTDPGNLMGGPSWRRSSPAPGVLSSPSVGVRPPSRPSSGAWDVFDASQLQREAKRSRLDGASPAHDGSVPSKQVDDHILHSDQLFGHRLPNDGVALAPLANIQGKNRLSLVDGRVAAGRTGRGQPDHDYIWRGIIAKGGTPVCHARCITLGEGIGSEIPEVVNISARTGLDLLTKHYADAIGYSIVYFLPDSEEDFASYTEFLRYLGSKNRAGVAKFDDGTTLFLVPPSEFLTKVLNVIGPERLYGVVLQFPHAPSGTSLQPESHQPQYMDGRQISSSRPGYRMMPQEDCVLPVDYNSNLQENSKPTPQPFAPPTNGTPHVSSVTQPSTTAVSQAGISLTPELIATLASLLPAVGKLPGSEGAQPLSGPSNMGFPSVSNAVPDKGLPQGWKNEYQAPEQIGPPLQQSGGQLNPLGQLLPQLQAYPTISNTSNLSAHGIVGNTQIQDSTFKLPQEGVGTSRPSTSFPIVSQAGQFVVSPQVDQQYQPKAADDAQRGYGVARGADGLGSYGPSSFQQPSNTMAFPNQVHGINVSQPHPGFAMASDRVNSEIPNQVQQLQSGHYGPGQGTSDSEIDKNQRYQSTLLFAANLLFQKPQQPNTQGGQGSQNH